MLDAEAFLRRTRVHVEIMHADGKVKVHDFPDSEQLDVCCAVAQLPPNRNVPRAIPAEHVTADAR